jgi:purine-binding chemotaxis protein CheW
MTTETVDAPPQAAEALHLLTFSIGSELVAMDIRTVREIIQVGPMTAVPLMPAFVRGVINLRGAVVPVIDLAVRLGRPRSTLGPKSCIIVFEGSAAAGEGQEKIELGLLVDAVSEVVEFAAESIEPPPQFGASVRRDFIQGMGKLGTRFVVVIDPPRAFDIEDMAGLCEASAAGAIQGRG